MSIVDKLRRRCIKLSEVPIYPQSNGYQFPANSEWGRAERFYEQHGRFPTKIEEARRRAGIGGAA